MHPTKRTHSRAQIILRRSRYTGRTCADYSFIRQNRSEDDDGTTQPTRYARISTRTPINTQPRTHDHTHSQVHHHHVHARTNRNYHNYTQVAHHPPFLDFFFVCFVLWLLSNDEDDDDDDATAGVVSFFLLPPARRCFVVGVDAFLALWS